mmetsp:Transcript_123425/g.360417  ORF Transcript_123425/g.360417 Transcript_123425/m.360417 type:complete len:221 (+) Transcript_123425:205-867(+)
MLQAEAALLCVVLSVWFLCRIFQPELGGQGFQGDERVLLSYEVARSRVLALGGPLARPLAGLVALGPAAAERVGGQQAGQEAQEGQRGEDRDVGGGRQVERAEAVARGPAAVAEPEARGPRPRAQDHEDLAAAGEHEVRGQGLGRRGAQDRPRARGRGGVEGELVVLGDLRVHRPELDGAEPHAGADVPGASVGRLRGLVRQSPSAGELTLQVGQLRNPA